MSVLARAEVTLTDVSDGLPGPPGESGQNGTMLYGTCTTAAATAAKTATVNGFSLYAGVTVSIKFTYANTASSPTLNVNGTGAKGIRTNGTAYAYWAAGATVAFVYDGALWQVCSAPVYANTATIGNPAGRNVYIDSDSVDIRNGASALASFESGRIALDDVEIVSGGGQLRIECPSGTHIRSVYDGTSVGEQVNHYAGLNVIANEQSLPQVIIGAYYNHAVTHSSANIVCMADGTGGTVQINKAMDGGSTRTGNLEDWVVAEGTSGSWKYRKWASGKAECWGTFSHYNSSFEWWNEKSYIWYGINKFTSKPYPFAFKGNPTVSIMALTDTGDASYFLGYTGDASKSPSGYVCTSDPGYNQSHYTEISIIANGRWK